MRRIGLSNSNKASKQSSGIIIKNREYLIKRREALGYSRMFVADELDMSLDYYYQIENGQRGKRMSVEMLARIAKVLKYERARLLENEVDYLIQCNLISLN